ncbi:MAG TPA: PspC domain-containing protein [Nocardioides sp.]|jgi:signal transduction histidine kinase/phage shock protein PspC (stress-responsive transcriptional regulator)|uniref:ATP-binding protein n=1 Tax=Nocardioides sp. TaxID=35761 RepID=UPI002E37818F|nr:PspC domain-containing protein [Nocardioides sp.]HEX3932509.1 PspC domain-containing protein [Nocardioides sp.]
MTATAPASETPGPSVRKAYRDTGQPIIGGVAAGLARHLGLPVVWVRAAFLVLAVLGGSGVLFYAGLWLVLPAQPFDREAPGLESASRQGRRPGRIRRLADSGPAVALVALGLGLVFTAEALFGGSGVLLWAVVLAVLGFGLLWRQADEAQRSRWLDQSERLNPVRAVFGDGGWAAYLRVGAGFVLVVSAMALFAVRHGHVQQVTDVLLSAALGGIGLAIVLGPWVWRLTNDLSAERAERVRTQERADLAAHLHDSVLQTLALIQKNAADAPTVARLARSQERDLRSWLFDTTPGGGTLAGALRELVREIEDTYGVDVELVTVGDVGIDDTTAPVVAATREATTNAAKHAGTPAVDIYAEVSPTAVEVFVRDRGAGFDPQAVPADRHGVRNSILDRMSRHGGTAEIRSTPKTGTEVRLTLPRGAHRGSRPDTRPDSRQESST